MALSAAGVRLFVLMASGRIKRMGSYAKGSDESCISADEETYS